MRDSKVCVFVNQRSRKNWWNFTFCSPRTTRLERKRKKRERKKTFKPQNIDEIATATIKSASNTSLIKKNSWDREKKNRHVSKTLIWREWNNKTQKSTSTHFEINRGENLFGCKFFTDDWSKLRESDDDKQHYSFSENHPRFLVCMIANVPKTNEFRFRAIGQ